MDILRGLMRQKGRSFLTISGIFVGILGLTVLGAMVERINTMLDITAKFFATQIMVMPKRSAGPFGGGFFTVQQLDQIRGVAGVKDVVPRINLLLELGNGFTFTLGLPPMIQAVDLNGAHNEWQGLKVRHGEMLSSDHEQGTVLGADLAQRLGAGVGDMITLNGHFFQVKGILEKTLSGPDNMALINIADGRRLLGGENLDLATSAAVIWDEGVDPEELSARLQRELEDVLVMSPGTAQEVLDQATLVINLIILGAAGVALIVGGLAVINTMMMSVSERTREIGIKMAVGAPPLAIVGEFLAESAAMGFMGGLLGIGTGGLLVRMANGLTGQRGVEIFYLSWRLVAAALLFAVVIGVLAGIYPAYRAAQLSCVQALRRE